jgi:hypothetical protein
VPESRPLSGGQTVKVLHVAGLHGTGTTILGNVLGEVDGVFAAGELANLWKVVSGPDVCTCGCVLTECDVWRRVLETLFTGPEEAMERLRPQPSWMDARRLPRLLWDEWRTEARLTSYRSMLGDLCRAIGDVTGARVIVETSKHPGFGRVLAGVPGTDPYVVHLVRDPRATAYSWLRKNVSGPGRIGATWTIWHWTIPRLWRERRDRYFALRYEDFVSSPRRAVAEILALVGEQGDLPFVDEHTVRLGPQHVPNGNPNRFRRGMVEVKADEGWRSLISRRQMLATTALTWPLLHRWGYPVRAWAGRADAR